MNVLEDAGVGTAVMIRLDDFQTISRPFRYSLQVLVSVQLRDLYKQKHPLNARTGPVHGPVRAP